MFKMKQVDRKKRYLEKHIVLQNKKVMSIGFTEIAVHDARTLLEETMSLFDKLSAIFTTTFDTISKDEVLTEIIKKLQNVMSDRASVMNAFDKMLHDYRKDILEEDISTHFLYCNVHFLLGLASAAEGVKLIEEKLKGDEGLLGRYNEKAFSNFPLTKENAVSRLVRLSAEVLGPRGNEKSGCREAWIAFCESINISSQSTSSGENRFNNLFENSSALIFHH